MITYPLKRKESFQSGQGCEFQRYRDRWRSAAWRKIQRWTGQNTTILESESGFQLSMSRNVPSAQPQRRNTAQKVTGDATNCNLHSPPLVNAPAVTRGSQIRNIPSEGVDRVIVREEWAGN